MNDLVLRPTSVLKYEDCGEAFRISEVLKIRTSGTSHALVFGTAVHKAVLPYVAAHATGGTVDTVALFEQEWAKQLSSKIVKFSSRDADELRSIGVRLAESFPAAWDASGFRAVVSASGVLVENRLRVSIRKGLVLSGEPDIVAFDADGRLVILDLKTPAARSFDGFAVASDQLTAYQLLLRAHLGALVPGRKIEKLGFFEGLKKKSAEWIPAQMADARSDEELGAYVSKLLMTEALIRKGYFPKRPAAAYNSPCSLCDYAKACLHKDVGGLTSPLGPVLELLQSDHLSVAA